MQAVIFDFDGVLTDTEKIYWQTWNQTIRSYGQKVSWQAWKNTFPGTGFHNVVRITNEWFALDLQDDDIIPKWLERYRARVKQGVELTPGAKQFLSRLKRSNIKVAIATGSNKENVQVVLRQHDLNRYSILDCEHEKKCKPAPDLFLHAAKELKVDPEECIVFEDGIAGIKAARAANMKVVALATTLPKSKIKGHDPDLIIKDFRGLTLRQLKAL